MAEELKQTASGGPGEGQLKTGVDFLSRALKMFFGILAAFIIVSLGWFLIFGGSFIVDTTTESVIVLQFGKFKQECKEGWHWFLPSPVNRIVRIPINKQEITSAAFMPMEPEFLYYQGVKADGSEPSDTDKKLVPGADGYVLLGNNSILHCEWAMTYRVTDPQKFYQTCLSTDAAENPAASAASGDSGGKGQTASLGPARVMLKNLLDDVVISSSAGLNLESTYYDRAKYEQTVKQALVDRIAAMDFGIALENLTLKIAAPPVVTIPSFQKLLLSETDAERVVEEARTYSVEQENLAKSESAKILADAGAYKLRVVKEVAADASYFNEIYAQYSKNKKATLVSLFSDTLAEAIAPVQDKFIVDAKGGGQSVLWLKVNQEPLQQRAPSAPAGAGGGSGEEKK
jgi:membrane protease subunit HflK